MKNWLGVEIGGTKQQIGIIGENGKILKVISERVELKRGAPDHIGLDEGKNPDAYEGIWL